jgi:mono/diheme cytochrome c family protein
VIFTDSCGGCHTLKAAGTNGGSGPELTNIGLTSGEVAKQVQNGGGGMPSFSGDLTPQQIESVAKFVDDNDGSN